MPTQTDGTGFWRRYPTTLSFAITILILVLGLAGFSVMMFVRHSDMQAEIGKLRSEINTERQVQFERNNEMLRRSTEMSGKLDKSAETSAKCYEKLDIIIRGMMQSGAKP